MNDHTREDFKDILARVSATFWPREATLALFLVAVITMNLAGLFSFFPSVNLIIGILVFYLASAFIFRMSIKKHDTAQSISNFYFAYDVLVELGCISLIVYLAGGVEWMGAIFLLFPVVYASVFLPRKRALAVCFLTTLSYALLASLTFFEIIPFHPYFNLGFPLYRNLKYVVNNVLLTGAVFFGIGIAANIFTDVLRKKSMELEKTKKDIEEQKDNLEVKVRARTEALERLSDSLKDKVRERTEELEEKMEELEKFNKLATGREMKMIELKGKIKQLEDQLKNK